MAPKKSSKSVSVVLSDPSEKKHVTRYDNSDEGTPLSSVYISKDALKSLGNPPQVRVTIEAA